MSEERVTLSMTLPLDGEGFLRRECPTCEREFKWLHTAEADTDTHPAEGGYFCPYCGVQAPTSAWLTQAQVALAQNTVVTEVVTPMIEGFSRDIGRIFRTGRISGRTQVPETAKLDPLTETDDMTRVDFRCHSSEPLKVLDDWHKPVYCLICGQPNS